MKQVANSTAWLILRSWRCRLHVPPKLQFTFDGLYGIISQEIGLFEFYFIWTQKLFVLESTASSVMLQIWSRTGILLIICIEVYKPITYMFVMYNITGTYSTRLLNYSCMRTCVVHAYHASKPKRENQYWRMQRLHVFGQNGDQHLGSFVW
jgi:hypothetical protein